MIQYCENEQQEIRCPQCSNYCVKKSGIEGVRWVCGYCNLNNREPRWREILAGNVKLAEWRLAQHDANNKPKEVTCKLNARSDLTEATSTAHDVADYDEWFP